MDRTSQFSPILLHSNLKHRYQRYRRNMIIIKTVSTLCFVVAIVLAACMIATSSAELFSRQQPGRAAVLAALPFCFIIGLGALTRMFTSRPK